MPQPKRGPGPWGDAIQFWLNDRRWSQTDLVRAVNADAVTAVYKGRKVQGKTISRIVRGFHIQTRLLERIAYAMQLSLDAVLVSPAERLADEERRQIAIAAAEEAIRLTKTKGSAYGLSQDPLSLVERQIERRESAPIPVKAPRPMTKLKHKRRRR